MTENEMVGRHCQSKGYEFEQPPEAGDEQEAWCATVSALTDSQTRLSN